MINFSLLKKHDDEICDLIPLQLQLWLEPRVRNILCQPPHVLLSTDLLLSQILHEVQF